MRLARGLLLAAGALWPMAGHSLWLVRQGQPQATIVIAAEGGPALEFAAQELQHYLREISRAELPIVREGERRAGTAIYVGWPRTVAAPLPKTLAKEEILLRSTARGLFLGGGSPRATIFAVYRFLEEVLGCRWLAPEIEEIPQRKDIAIGIFEKRSAPSFEWRTFVGGGNEARQRWGLKMGLNGFYRAEDAARNGGCYYLPEAVPGCHAYARLIPPEKYFEAHPDWFPLLGGKRYRSSLLFGQLCVTAPGLAEEFAQRVIEIFDADPQLRLISISPNDGYGWCECPACQALDKKLNGGRLTKQGLLGERPFIGDRVFWFANQVAERVARRHPDRLLLELAYINYAEPPDTIRPAPNVVPWLCHYAPADYARPINDPRSEANAQFNALLRRWAKIAPRLLFYSYVSKSMWWRLPRPVWRNFAADLKYLYRLGIRRYYCQSALSDWALDGSLYYVLAKLMWDIQADPEALAQDWLQHMFGAAAPAMRAYYDAVERAVRKTGRPYADNPPAQVPGLYDHEELAEAKRHLEAALAAPVSATQRARIEEIARVFAYGWHMIRAIELAERFQADLDLPAWQEALQEGDRALQQCSVREAKEYLDRFRSIADLGVIARGLGPAQELGGRKCWNTDETGPGDGKAGWADFIIPTPDPTKPIVVELDVWGQSQLDSLVINTDGTGRGHAAGGVWNPVRPEKPLSGEARWETLVFRIAPELMAQGKKAQRIGLGAGDSQIWIAAVRVRPAER